jgi:16S rRNA (uracil1498-N3)-methyltransferase
VHRFFVPAGSIRGDHVSLPPEQARQIRTVLRLRPGERIVVLDNSGDEYVVRLIAPYEGRVEERRRNVAEPVTPVSLYQGTLKGDKLDLVLQKGTEIGISRFVPVITERSVAGEPGESKQRRYRAIVQEAAEQSGRGTLPEVAPAISLADALHSAEGTILIPWEEEKTNHLRSVSLAKGERVSLFIGPEGGFSASEIESARQAGARVVSLGTRILRADTAAIVAASLLLAAADDLG